MEDILLHSSKMHKQAVRTRKNFRPLPTTVAQGVKVAIKLIKQTQSSKLDATKH